MWGNNPLISNQIKSTRWQNFTHSHHFHILLFLEEEDDDFEATEDGYNFKVTCDNEVKVYVDNKQIQLKRPRQFDWTHLDHFSAGENANVLGVKCTNLDGLGGILLSGQGNKDGENVTIISNKRWRSVIT